MSGNNNVKTAGLVAFLAAALAFSAAALAACLNYGGRVTIRGTLTRQVFPGPPNYESIAHGDTPETYYVLRLNPAACVAANPPDPDEPAVRNLTNMQLMLTGPEQYSLLRPLLDKQVSLSGTLFAAITGHHHTPVLLEDVQLEGQ